MKGDADCGMVGFESLNYTGMKRMPSTRKSSNTRGTSTSSGKTTTTELFAVCVRNDGHEASLERNKIYAVVPDEDAERDGDLRVIGPHAGISSRAGPSPWRH